jgi:hypothetical protein
MTSSDAMLAREWLVGILLRLAPRRLERLIDEPVDAVTNHFRASLQPIRSHPQLVAVIAAYVQQLHEKALPMKGAITFHEAFADGVAMLNAGQRNGSTGYDHAMLSIQSGGDGEEVVLQIGAMAKTRERQAMVKWTIEDATARCTWDVRRRLVAGIVEILGDDLPSDVRSRPPEQWAPFLGDLVHVVYQAIVQMEAARPKRIGADEDAEASLLSLLIKPSQSDFEPQMEKDNVFNEAEA